jgi:hypothetical protein
VFLRDDPMDLVRLAESGELYEYLLDRYLKAAVNAPGEPGGPRPRHRLDPAEVWRYLAVLARYLHASTTARTRVAGRELSGSDIVLHELWPLAGSHRPRVVGSMLMLLAGLLSVLGTLVLSLGGDSYVMSNAFFWGVFGVMASVAAYVVAWPKPTRITLRLLTTFSGFGRAVTATLAVGVVAAVLGGLYYGSGDQPPPETFLDRLWALFHWQYAAGWMGLALLLHLTFSVQDHPVSEPRSILRSDLAAWLFSAVLLGPLGYLELLSQAKGDRILPDSGLLMVVVMLGYGGLLSVLGCALIVSVKDVFPAIRGFRGALGGSASLRYVSFLLCTRGRLPWRLGRFLHHCYQLGLVRVAGAAYQFRHRELQEHLATRPHPPGI